MQHRGQNWNYDSNVAQGLGDEDEIRKRNATDQAKRLQARIGAFVLFGTKIRYLLWKHGHSMPFQGFVRL